MSERDERVARVLAKQGVFAGHFGLEGLAAASGFWEQQPYGARLYYGPGATDYLHRGVLESAIEALRGIADQPPPATDPERVEIARCPHCGGLPRPTLLGRTICDRCGGLDVPQPPSPTVLRQVEALTASQPTAAHVHSFTMGVCACGERSDAYLYY